MLADSAVRRIQAMPMLVLGFAALVGIAVLWPGSDEFCWRQELDECG